LPLLLSSEKCPKPISKISKRFSRCLGEG